MTTRWDALGKTRQHILIISTVILAVGFGIFLDGLSTSPERHRHVVDTTQRDTAIALGIGIMGASIGGCAGAFYLTGPANRESSKDMHNKDDGSEPLDTQADTDRK